MSGSAPSNPRLPPARASRSVPQVVAGLAVIVLAAAVAFLATRPLGGPTTQSSSLPPAGSAVPGTGIGQAAPDFVSADGTSLLADADGNPIRLAAFAGRPLWIVFWATWCIPCQEEAGDIVAAYHSHRDEGLEVLAIDVQEPSSAVRAFAAEHGIDYRIGLDATGQVRARYGGFGLPVHVFLDRHGVIRDRSIGQLPRTAMEQRLRSILGS